VLQRRPREPLPSRTTPAGLPPPVFEAWSWGLRGKCVGYPSEVFFPETARGQRLRATEQIAKQICAACPVLTECREYALSAPETYGIWGALTARERMRLATSRSARRASSEQRELPAPDAPIPDPQAR
jgi:WhiB family redox-sensing transcriptional regulator